MIYRIKDYIGRCLASSILNKIDLENIKPFLSYYYFNCFTGSNSLSLNIKFLIIKKRIIKFKRLGWLQSYTMA